MSDETLVAALPERIASKIHIDENGCWLWTGYVYPNGYGYTHQRVSLGEFKAAYVHRFVYETLVGPIVNEIDHLCRVRHCCNPSHLEDVTRAENLRRGRGFGGINYRKTHCVNGHEFNDENTLSDSRGRRSCRACSAIRAAKRKPRKGPYADPRVCSVCASPYVAAAAWQVYCGSACRKANRRYS